MGGQRILFDQTLDNGSETNKNKKAGVIATNHSGLFQLILIACFKF
jgi:hypothetical protein